MNTGWFGAWEVRVIVKVLGSEIVSLPLAVFREESVAVREADGLMNMFINRQPWIVPFSDEILCAINPIVHRIGVG